MDLRAGNITYKNMPRVSRIMKVNMRSRPLSKKGKGRRQIHNNSSISIVLANSCSHTLESFVDIQNVNKVN